jgi:hypothetical protein
MQMTWFIKSEGGNPFCGGKLLMEGTYTVAAPNPMWVEASP